MCGQRGLGGPALAIYHARFVAAEVRGDDDLTCDLKGISGSYLAGK
jgi:hypothetical protein